jgi:hypothetical protein
VELFHLLFLRQLASGKDRTHLTLKGGGNLRFFFRSIRYSEDIDLDVKVIASGTLRNKVDRLLHSPGLLLPLEARGISLVDVSAPKQTETTQRWKIGLSVAGQGSPARTRIEFSRRERAAGWPPPEVGPVDAAVCRPHGLPPPVLQHDVAPTAIVQKIQALLGRPQTQARDVFDLHLLAARPDALPRLSTPLQADLPRAIERAMSLSYDDYLSQVVAFLVPEQAAALRDRATWDSIQTQVVELLEGLRP